MSIQDRLAIIKCESGLAKDVKIINPKTGEALPGVIDVTIRFRDEKGGKLAVPIATVEMYARVDVAAALNVLPVEWDFEGRNNKADLV